jgi:hypothetical protein
MDSQTLSILVGIACFVVGALATFFGSVYASRVQAKRVASENERDESSASKVQTEAALLLLQPLKDEIKNLHLAIDELQRQIDSMKGLYRVDSTTYVRLDKTAQVIKSSSDVQLVSEDTLS